MAGWVILYVLSVSLITRHVITTRQAAKRPSFRSWVREDAATEQVATAPAVEPERLVTPEPVVAWTELDDRQLERFLSQSSS